MKKSILSIFALSFVLIAAFSLMCGPAAATVIYTDTMTITGGDPTQLGRINRNGVPSDWSAPKAFPGVINPTTSYHYTTLDLDLAALESPYSSYGAYIQISFDSISTNTFLSAYQDSYSPLNMPPTIWATPALAAITLALIPCFSRLSYQAPITWCWCSTRQRPAAVWIFPAVSWLKRLPTRLTPT